MPATSTELSVPARGRYSLLPSDSGRDTRSVRTQPAQDLQCSLRRTSAGAFHAVGVSMFAALTGTMADRLCRGFAEVWSAYRFGIGVAACTRPMDATGSFPEPFPAGP